MQEAAACSQHGAADEQGFRKLRQLASVQLYEGAGPGEWSLGAGKQSPDCKPVRVGRRTIFCGLVQGRGTGGFRQGVCTLGKSIIPKLFLQQFRLSQAKSCIFCHCQANVDFPKAPSPLESCFQCQQAIAQRRGGGGVVSHGASEGCLEQVPDFEAN